MDTSLRQSFQSTLVIVLLLLMPDCWDDKLDLVVLNLCAQAFDGREGISWTPDRKIVYAAPASGHLDLWMVEANGTGQKQLTADAGNNRRPSVSLDGRHVVFVSDRTGKDHVWRSDIGGSNARQLTNGYGEWNPECSPNGQWVLYQMRFGKENVWKVLIWW